MRLCVHACMCVFVCFHTCLHARDINHLIEDSLMARSDSEEVYMKGIIYLILLNLFLHFLCVCTNICNYSRAAILIGFWWGQCLGG